MSVPTRIEDHKSWAKLVEHLDREKSHGYALQGPWLDRGADYHLPIGALVVTVDVVRHTDRGDHGRNRVRLVMWRVDNDADAGLRMLGEWSRWDHIGKYMLGRVAKALTQQSVRVPGGVEHLKVTPEPDRPNLRAERCHRCRQMIEPYDGLLVRKHGIYLVQHPDRCPDRPNSYPGRCDRCDRVVEAYCGILQQHEDGSRRVLHRDPCPEHVGGLLLRLNSEPGPCAVCWQEVPPRDGVLVGPPGAQQPLHDPHCPPNPYNPDAAETWQVRENAPRPGAGYDYPPGTVARVATDTPITGPGSRELLDGGHSLIGVVIAVAPRHHVRDTYGRLSVERIGMWRPATEDEAAPVLRAELRLLVESGLLAQARPLVTLLPGAPVLGATTPTTEELLNVALWKLPRVWLPSGGSRPESTLVLDEDGEAVWTLIHNSHRGDDWTLSNYGGYIAYHHPWTPQRAELIRDLREHQNLGRAHP